MNRIEEGKVYTAVRQRSGSSDRGPWEMLIVQDERGSNELAIFASNIPTGVPEGGKFRVDRINSVSLGNKKDSSGNWRVNVSVSAEVCPVKSYDEYTAGADEGSLPF